ncbi:aldo/keto reductase [Microterricola viridarii]|uniref:Oxidoreductase n=1 Tax=Microterricola viridarii TaxID=412690 RepID=A0A109QX26_9MICO|nr:aldo/keto reductase [Microterricola viridarii]AMB59222.1 oxidoreductase [Microterricola viridarii]
MDLGSTLPLNDGALIPRLGAGTYKVPDADAPAVVEGAVAAGYRHIDTAALYGNERGVGRGIRSALQAQQGLVRSDLFVTTKVWNTEHGFDATLRAFDASLEALGLDSVELYLIHWPAPAQNRYVETWRALVRLREEGRARSIGVSNFHREHLERIIEDSGVVPAVNQIELQPWLPQAELRALHAELGIVTEAWSPLARGRAVTEPVLAEIGRRHGKSAAQVTIRWHLQLGNVVIPKSLSAERLRANADVFDFELDAAELAAIAALDTGERSGSDPDLVD